MQFVTWYNSMDLLTELIFRRLFLISWGTLYGVFYFSFSDVNEVDHMFCLIIVMMVVNSLLFSLCRGVLQGPGWTGLDLAWEQMLLAMDWWVVYLHILFLLAVLHGNWMQMPVDPTSYSFVLQVFFAQLILADMNKELKGLRFVAWRLWSDWC